MAKTPVGGAEINARGPGAPTWDKRKQMQMHPNERMPQIPGVQKRPEPQWAIDDRRRRKIFAEREAIGLPGQKVIEGTDPKTQKAFKITTSKTSRDR